MKNKQLLLILIVATNGFVVSARTIKQNLEEPALSEADEDDQDDSIAGLTNSLVKNAQKEITQKEAQHRREKIKQELDRAYGAKEVINSALASVPAPEEDEEVIEPVIAPASKRSTFKRQAIPAAVITPESAHERAQKERALKREAQQIVMDTVDSMPALQEDDEVIEPVFVPAPQRITRKRQATPVAVITTEAGTDSAHERAQKERALKREGLEIVMEAADSTAAHKRDEKANQPVVVVTAAPHAQAPTSKRPPVVIIKADSSKERGQAAANSRAELEKNELALKIIEKNSKLSATTSKPQPSVVVIETKSTAREAQLPAAEPKNDDATILNKDVAELSDKQQDAILTKAAEISGQYALEKYKAVAKEAEKQKAAAVERKNMMHNTRYKKAVRKKEKAYKELLNSIPNKDLLIKKGLALPEAR